MTKLLNGIINGCGVIVSTDDCDDSGSKDSLLYQIYESGRVKAKLYLAEFSDGQGACSSDVMTSYCGYGYCMTMDDKMNREEAIEKENARIVEYLNGVIQSSDSYSTSSLKRDCQRVIERIERCKIPTLF